MGPNPYQNCFGHVCGLARVLVERGWAPAQDLNYPEEHLVYAVKTVEGPQIRCSVKTKFLTEKRGHHEVDTLRPGDRVLLCGSADGTWGDRGSFDLGVVLGAAVAGFSNHDTVTVSRKKLGITSDTDLFERGFRGRGVLPPLMWRASEACVQGFLQALLFGRLHGGTVAPSIGFIGETPELTKDVQLLLGTFGIWGSIFGSRRVYLHLGLERLRSIKERVGFLADTIALDRFPQSAEPTWASVDQVELVGIQKVCSVPKYGTATFVNGIAIF